MLRRLVSFFVAAVALALPANATWSICLVNLKTGEVAVASATCLPNTNLMAGLPLVRVGVGVAAIQSAGWEPGLIIINDMMALGATPDEMMAAVIAAAPQPQQLQIGIASIHGVPATFTGNKASRAKGGVFGQDGDWWYAIQGNILTGSNVWLDCRDALLDTNGDTAERLMAAMQAARFAGGDGRCSCDTFQPTSCGSPPPSFSKSAHCAFMIVSRMGDRNPTCSNGFDCAEDGRYHLKLNIKGANTRVSSPDPVLQLQQRYDAWRGNLMGRADGLLSTTSAIDALPADGVTTTTVTVNLVDIEGVPLKTGGDNVQVATVDGGPSITALGPVVDNGDGSYSFTLTAGTTVGTDEFAISASIGGKRATLYPYLTMRSDPASLLHVGYDEVSAGEAPSVPFVLNDAANAGARYLVMASLNGTTPGSRFGETFLPLNPPLISVLNSGVDEGKLPGTLGRLDGSGRAQAAMVAGTPMLMNLIGSRVDWAAVVLTPTGWTASAATGFDIVP